MSDDETGLLAAVGRGDGGCGGGLLGVDASESVIDITVQTPAGSPSDARDGRGADDGPDYALADPAEVESAVAALRGGLETALPPGAAATAVVAPATGGDAGLIRVTVRAMASTPASLHTAAAAAAAVLKGALPGGPPSPAALVTLRASSAAAAALIRAILLPRLLLRAAAAREAAVALGAPPGTGAEVVPAAAAAAGVLSRGEAQALLERERRAVISGLAAGEVG